jgi:ribose transport system substrate-binding protein
MSGWRTLQAATLGLIGALAIALPGLLTSQAFADESPTPQQQAAALANVPKDAQQYYQGYWYSTKLVTDPLANWQPHKAP